MKYGRPIIESDDEFTYAGVRYITSTSDYTKVSGPDGIVLLKPKQWVTMYYDFVETEGVRNVLELGVWQGGMSILLPSFNPDLKYMGIEYEPERESITTAIANMPNLKDRVHIEYGLSQSDPKVPEKVVGYFGSPEIDLVIDDASHQYAESRRSFELLFPMLRSGAAYIVEDWAWAHWQNHRPNRRVAYQPSLSNLLFEICILAASCPEVVSSVEVKSALFIVRRGSAKIEPGWRLSDSLRFNGQSSRLPLLKPSLAYTIKRKLGLA
jgi:predicted O-methyltransferase YrrM